MSEKRILITGATGFIGSNILRFGLEKKEATFFAVVRKNTKNLWRIKDLIDSHSVNIIELDLTDIASVNEMMKQIKPDVVFHCATYGMFLDKEKDFNSMIEINIKSLISLINFAFENKVKTFINTGSTSEYGIKTKPMKENMSLEPVNMYGATKAAGTIIASQIARTLKFNLVTLRLSSPFGPYEDKRRLIPSLILSVLDKKNPSLSSPYSVRDFIYVKDVANAFFKASEKNDLKPGDIFNIGRGKQKSVKDIVKIVEKVSKTRIEPEWGRVISKQQEPKVWRTDNRKAINSLSWKPFYTLFNGLKETFDWFKINKNFYTKGD